MLVHGGEDARGLGVPGAQWMTSGVAMGPITSLTVATSSFLSCGGGGYSVPCTCVHPCTCWQQADI